MNETSNFPPGPKGGVICGDAVLKRLMKVSELNQLRFFLGVQARRRKPPSRLDASGEYHGSLWRRNIVTHSTKMKKIRAKMPNVQQFQAINAQSGQSQTFT